MRRIHHSREQQPATDAEIKAEQGSRRRVDAIALDEPRLAVLLRIHGIGKANGNAEAPAELLASIFRRADESILIHKR